MWLFNGQLGKFLDCELFFPLHEPSNDYDEDLYENNYLGFLYYYELLNSIEEMVNKYYQDYHSTFYD